jgi:hypothetical protein
MTDLKGTINRHKAVIKVNDHRELSDQQRRLIAARSCALKVLAAAGLAFLALASASENLVKYLYMPGYVWIVGGTLLAGWWAYENYCIGDPPT